MRFFSGDALLGLSLPAHDLPGPWIVPYHLPRRHRDRLVRLLWRALAGFEPRLHFVELLWAERSLLEDGSLRLPGHTLVWWRIEALQTEEPVAVVRKGGSLWPGLAVYDFEQDDGIPAHAWLGALKLEVLRRLVDVLLDEKPVRDVEELTHLLGNVAGKLESPVDLLDFGQVAIEQAALRTGLAEARTLAYARILSARFDVEEGPADAIIRALAALAREGDVPAVEYALARRAGLVEPSGARLPIADVLRERDVFRRTVLQVVASRALEAPLWELAPDWFSRGEEGEVGTLRSPAVLYPTLGSTEPELPSSLDARAGAERPQQPGSTEGIEKLVRAALRTLESSHSHEELKSAADQLKSAVQILARTIGEHRGPASERVAALYERVAEAYEKSGWANEAARAFVETGDWRLLAYQQAASEEAFTRACSLAEAGNDRQVRAHSLLGLGRARWWKDDHAGARAAYESALESYRELGDRVGGANTHRALGELYVRTARLKEAEAAYQQALPIYQAIDDHVGEANTHRALGELYVRTDRLKEAEAAYQQALTIYQAIDDHVGEANTHRALGDLYVRTARLKEAEAAYQQALPIFQAIDFRRGEAYTCWVLGTLYKRTDRLKEAEAAYQQALPIYQAIGFRLGEAYSRWALGTLYVRTARLKEAEAAYQQALTIYQAIDDRLGEANTRRALGDLYVRTARFKEAEGAYQQALPIYQAIDSRFGETNTLRCLARLSYLAGVSVADESWDRVIHQAREISDPHGEWLGQTFFAAQRFPKEPSSALETWAEALRYFEHAGLRLEAQLTQALLQLGKGEAPEQVLSSLAAELGSSFVEPLRTAAAGGQDALLRGIVALLPGS